MLICIRRQLGRQSWRIQSSYELILDKNFPIRSEFLYVEFDLKEILILTEGYYSLMTQIFNTFNQSIFQYFSRENGIE